MSKPEDIPQDVWQAAKVLWSRTCSPQPLDIEDMARAIMAAEKRGEDRERADAERWRAFISSDRFYVMGSAGFTAEGDVNPDRPDQGNWLHFTLNVWDAHPAGNDRQGTHGRKLLLAYVDHMVQRRAAIRNRSTK